MTSQVSESEKGVLFFSFDNGLVDYKQLTEYATSLVHKHLGLPVCVVTDNPDAYPYADTVVTVVKDSATKRYFKDYEQEAPWHNIGREKAFDLSPWRHTIVLDVDYLVHSSVLLKYLTMPLALSRQVQFLGSERYEHLTHMPMTHLPMYWATVMVFDRQSYEAQVFFDWMKRIRKAWPYFSQMAGVDPNLYRNDYVATLALSFMNGVTWSRKHDLPVQLVTAGFDCQVRSVTDKGLTFKVSRIPNDYEVRDLDVHVFNKKDLIKCLQGVKDVPS